MAIDAADYSSTILNDDCSGTPDNWTDSNATHSFSAGVMTVIDDGAASEWVYNASGNSDADWYFKIRMRYTAQSGDPYLIQIQDTNDSLAAGVYRDDGTGSINVRDGAGFSDTGIDVALNTWMVIELKGNTDSNTYEIEIDDVAGGGSPPYDGISGTGVITELLIGGGSAAPTWTMEVDYVLFKDTLAVGAAGAMSTNTGYWGPTI